MRDCRMRLRVSRHCGVRSMVRAMGNVGSQVARPAMKWFLKVCIACSARFHQWLSGGTNLIVLFLYFFFAICFKFLVLCLLFF